MARRPSPPPRPRSPWRRRFVIALRVVLVLAVLAVGALVTAVYVARSELPSFDELKSSPNGQMIRVHAADGTVIVSLGPSYGQWLAIDQIPDVMKKAMVSVEDRRFYDHPGVDPVALMRITRFAIRYHGTGRRLQGASTITQQVARTVFLSNRYSVGRKLREMILALALERKFTKAQILDLYLNKVYFGGGAYGIDAASRRFFGHGAEHLSLDEAAIIAGLVKAPSEYSPTADAQAAVDRAGVVLDLMVQTGAITPAQAAAANPQEIKLAPEPKQNSVRYFTDWALPQLDTLVDETQKPLEVWTTLDLSKQRAADAAIRADVPAGAQGALVSLDRDGAVRAMVGGTDYVTSNYNRATQAVRQPGSAFKLFVYLSALEAGKKPGSIEVDAPVTIDGWSPRNDSRHNSGPVTLRTAFAYSINTIAAKLGQEVGFQTIADMARRFGITTPVNTHPSMVLGTSEVRVIDMTRAFASVANKGVAVTPYGITRVVADGEVIYEHQVDQSHVLVAPYVAAEMTDLLQTTVATGTGRAAQLDRPVAGKTGTTTSTKDGWFLGFSSGLTTGVWMGRDDARPVPGLHGGAAPAQAFHDYMKVAVADRPVEQFDTQVTLPDWQDGPYADSYFSGPDNGVFVDGDGNPVAPDGGPADGQSQAYPGDQPQAYAPAQPQPQSPSRGRDADGATTTTTTTTQPAQAAPPSGQRLDQDWIDRVTGRQPPGPARSAPSARPNGAAPSRTPPARDRAPAVPGDRPSAADRPRAGATAYPGDRPNQ